MNEIASKIGGSEKLVEIFGGWPTFHDAVVMEFNLSRGNIESEAGRWVFPFLTTTIHLWELTNTVMKNGGLLTIHHTLAEIRFHDVEAFEMRDFNHHNAIFGLSINWREREDQPSKPRTRRRSTSAASSPFFEVAFEQADGISAEFECRRIEVLRAVPFPGGAGKT